MAIRAEDAAMEERARLHFDEELKLQLTEEEMEMQSHSNFDAICCNSHKTQINLELKRTTTKENVKVYQFAYPTKLRAVVYTFPTLITLPNTTSINNKGTSCEAMVPSSDRDSVRERNFLLALTMAPSFDCVSSLLCADDNIVFNDNYYAVSMGVGLLDDTWHHTHKYHGLHYSIPSHDHTDGLPLQSDEGLASMGEKECQHIYLLLNTLIC
ncbi:cyclin-D4-2-like [Senna tora]|uniref:Cyclin-D4-2-like n=1 Tax=Senna tora TaxID=362788 RepID=A0A834X6Z4_9FABA|nr:cyclin-D4-2-like [Senna tora]